MASWMGCGAERKPMRMPAERTLERLSNRTTRPTSGWSFSSAKYDGGRGEVPKYR